jgi:hypothetical protein
VQQREGWTCKSGSAESEGWVGAGVRSAWGTLPKWQREDFSDLDLESRSGSIVADSRGKRLRILSDMKTRRGSSEAGEAGKGTFMEIITGC